jgi:hypothetical protein
VTVAAVGMWNEGSYEEWGLLVRRDEDLVEVKAASTFTA